MSPIFRILSLLNTKTGSLQKSSISAVCNSFLLEALADESARQIDSIASPWRLVALAHAFVGTPWFLVRVGALRRQIWRSLEQRHIQWRISSIFDTLVMDWTSRIPRRQHSTRHFVLGSLKAASLHFWPVAETHLLSCSALSSHECDSDIPDSDDPRYITGGPRYRALVLSLAKRTFLLYEPDTGMSLEEMKPMVLISQSTELSICDERRFPSDHHDDWADSSVGSAEYLQTYRDRIYSWVEK
ncbi:hypothetical protein BT96DRAFT_1022347 [Gymnopus androsaceus JB14]|uniref:Uncharacterized protein n=1 Tax=Gymnopus androsaceus JB14 TaxID=1447944 RepID=A0A6A4HCH4_9AGAR|nr:hypothetical protein BT96DRAFT_1022347 [Gymnopus androsaceus JB14]